MMSLEIIDQMSRKAGQKAARLKRQPLVAFTDKDSNVVKCPNFGSYRPKGWRLVKTLFVDSSGFGSGDEPALTKQQFIETVRAGFGYAIIEQGQFQLYIGVFEKLK